MRKADVVAYFGDQTKVAQALQIDPAAVSQWGEMVPEKRAARLERLTKGVRQNGVTLKYNPDLYHDQESGPH